MSHSNSSVNGCVILTECGKKIYPNPKTLLEHKKLTFQSEKGKEINKRMSGETCNWRQ